MQPELLFSAARGYNSSLNISNHAHRHSPSWGTDFAHPEDSTELLRQSIADVRHQAASRLMADMLSSENYDLSSFSEDTSELRPGAPLGFKDLLQPHEAASMYAAMQSDIEPEPVSAPVWSGRYAAAHPLAHFPLVESQQTEAPHHLSAAHSQYSTPAQSGTDYHRHQLMQQAQQFRLAALQTSGYAGHAAHSVLHPQSKAYQQPTTPITPDMVDVARQQRRKRNYADITDAHAIVEHRM